MPPKRDITDDTRVIDLTVAELLALLTERLGLGAPSRVVEPSDGLLDTWQTAKLLGIFPRRPLPDEPARGTVEHQHWRRAEQQLRNEVARRLQTWLDRHPELAELAVRRSGERRRYFRRGDVEAFLAKASRSPARRRLRQ
ncbi:MAG: hypothetical protein JNM40_19320 [Myxococcales bacterium]|nr:hypothetical protein [Myxococcales bacterium]